MLSNSDIEALEDILFAEPWGDDALDFFGFHGVVCASVVGPADLGAEEVFRLATGIDEAPDGGVPEVFRRCAEQLAGAMAHALDMGQALELPEPEDGDPMNALENWCAGFVDTFLAHEEQWLDAASEEETADLMVPMLALSGLFDDEDFQKVRNSDKLSRHMADAIPDSLTDLYLLFHAPD
ncbi:YecA family protein [Marinobacter sp. SS8-8]|uniref:YecA/YgfB family protein n=1 Tax=Marinobacter sp. SS8-8 TaxID=3050452 RepID=UPI000C546FD6|nr:YecA family protein [Marinobacter sp. SS8-8]MAZ05632.1 YecA family protein [Halomonas sp.]|tara:strand:+ start:33008 stop:33550 length:543 start_codon:yes stop_codon:yes gene_type:complete